MFAISILSIAIQAALIVHAIKTGRNTLWIWAIALLPPLGPIAYVAVELLPELSFELLPQPVSAARPTTARQPNVLILNIETSPICFACVS